MTPQRNVKIYVYVEDEHEGGAKYVVAMKDNGYIVFGDFVPDEQIEQMRNSLWQHSQLMAICGNLGHDFTLQWVEDREQHEGVIKAKALAVQRTHGEGNPNVDYDGDV